MAPHESEQVRKNRQEIAELKEEMKKISENRDAYSTSPTKRLDFDRNYQTLSHETMKNKNNRSRSRILRSKLFNDEEIKLGSANKIQDISTNKFSYDQEQESDLDRNNISNYATLPARPNPIKSTTFESDTTEDPKPPGLHASMMKNVKADAPGK